MFFVFPFHRPFKIQRWMSQMQNQGVREQEHFFFFAKIDLKMSFEGYVLKCLAADEMMRLGWNKLSHVNSHLCQKWWMERCTDFHGTRHPKVDWSIYAITFKIIFIFQCIMRPVIIICHIWTSTIRGAFVTKPAKLKDHRALLKNKLK